MTTKSPSSQAIDAVIQQHVKPLMKAEGFKKSARTFYRLKEELIQVVNFQSSMWNTPDRAQFTINLNIVLPAFHEKWTGLPVPKNPYSAAAVCQYRIGRLMPEGRDHWWEVSPESDSDVLSREVAEAIRTLGLPFLDRASDLDYLLDKLQSDEHFPGIVINQSLAAAILLHSMGRPAEAQKTIKALRQRNTHTGFAGTIDRIEARLSSNNAIHTDG